MVWFYYNINTTEGGNMADNPIAVAWQMVRPAYTSAGGYNRRARHAQVMIVDRFVIVGSGYPNGAGGNMKYELSEFSTDRAARRHGITLTQRLEKQGYELFGELRTKVCVDTWAKFLAPRVGRAAMPDPDMFGLFANILGTGDVLIQGLSPAVSPV